MTNDRHGAHNPSALVRPSLPHRPDIVAATKRLNAAHVLVNIKDHNIKDHLEEEVLALIYELVQDLDGVTVRPAIVTDRPRAGVRRHHPVQPLRSR